jgi:hypothetical protein
LIGNIDLKSDVEVPSLEVIEASHEERIAEPPPSLDGLCDTLFDSAQHNDLPVPFFAI